MQERIYVLLMISLVFLFVSVSGISAQEKAQMPPEKTAFGAEITDGVLDKVVSAYVKIIQINENLQNSLQTAKDQKERMKLQESANTMMVKAIGDSGIEVETYNEVMQQISADKELSKEFVKKIENKTGG